MTADAAIEKKEKGFVSHLFFWMAVGFVSVAIYVLSIGPVLKCVTPNPLLEAVYAPLFLVLNHSKLAQQLFLWYVGNIWGVDYNSL